MTGVRFEARGRAGRLIGRASGPIDAGRALPILFVHGINMSSDVWADVAGRLAVSRRIVTFDLRGHGASDREGPFTANDYADDVLAVMDHLAIPRAHIVGTSFGGSVACVLAAIAPERVASIAAFGSALAIEGLDVEAAVAALRSAGVRPFFAAFMPQATFAPGTDPSLIERALDAAATGRDVDTVIAVARTALGSDLREIASRVKHLALVVTGELDATCPVAAGAEMAKRLGVEHRVVAGRGHVLSMEDPDAFVSLLSAHVSAHDERST